MARRNLYCFILGDYVRGVFPATISEVTHVKGSDIPFKDFTVAYLKDLIWELREDILSSSNVDLWKVEIEETDNIIKKLENIKTDIQAEFGDAEKIINLIDNLNTIDTNQPIFRVPPLPGDSEYTTIYNRQCYPYFREFIFNDKDFKRYFITGNPGIGKTYFGRLLLVTLLKKGKTVLMDHKDFTLYINPKEKMTFIVNTDEYKLFAQDSDTWCIIDERKPQISHDFNVGKLIMVSSPKKELIKDFVKASKCKSMYMPVWEKDEVLDYCELLKIDSITLVMEKFKLCGGIARLIFDPSMNLKCIEKIIERAVTSIDSKILDYQGKTVNGDELTHKLIHIHTNLPSDDEEDPYTDSIYYFASEHVANFCLEKLKKDNNKELRKFMNNAKDISEMGSLRGQLFEMICHVILRSGKDFSVRELPNGHEFPDDYKSLSASMNNRNVT
ncbi:4828_t:CDS:2 [Rhizophagus irregularis]|nr:4828_t:CDS:2 [Rhizophagus irregularis]